MKNKSEEIVEVIGKKIVTGEYAELETIPKMEVLAETYQVSRTVIREALKVLSRMRMVESVKKGGTTVLPRSEWNWWDQQILQWVIDDINRSGNNHSKLILHLTEMRLALEPMALCLATKRGSEEDFEEITKRFLKLKQSKNDSEEWAIADYEFHLALVKASCNHLMINTLTKLNKALQLSRKKTYRKLNVQSNSEEFERAYQKHVDLYEAMMERNTEKVQFITTEIINKVYELILQELDE